VTFFTLSVMNVDLRCLPVLKGRKTMAAASSWGGVLAAATLLGCAPGSARHPSAPDVHDTTDAAVARAIHCASDLDLLAASNPDVTWTALQAEATPVRIAAPAAADRGALEHRSRAEVARRLQAVLDSRSAVDRLDAHAGPWGSPHDPEALVEHVRSVSVGLCRTRDAAQALVSPAAIAPAAMSHLLTVEGARD
jgi:hypothetical protein